MLAYGAGSLPEGGDGENASGAGACADGPGRTARARPRNRGESADPRGGVALIRSAYNPRVDFSFDFTPALLVAFLTLFVLEIVLGVDNIIFISILAGKLPVEQQAKARNTGLVLAMVLRIGLVAAAGWIISLQDDLFELFGHGFSGRDLILILGGLFLVYKAATEIHHKIDGDEHEESGAPRKAAFWPVIGQILIMDIVFSFDSVITAVGMVHNFWIIIAAVVASFGLMLFAAKHVFTFVDRNPSVKMLALSFLLLIGAMLIAEGFEVHVEKAFIYGPVAFALLVEALNLLYRRKRGTEQHARELNDSWRGQTAEPVRQAVGRHDAREGAIGLSGRPVSLRPSTPNAHGAGPASQSGEE